MLKFILGVLSSVVSVFTFTTLFNWFIAVPFGVPPISYAVAVGTMLLYSTLTSQLNFSASKTIRDDKFKVEEYVMATVVFRFVVLAIGWVTKTYFM